LFGIIGEMKPHDGSNSYMLFIAELVEEQGCCQKTQNQDVTERKKQPNQSSSTAEAQLWGRQPVSITRFCSKNIIIMT
jgi:hypothetical protein